MNKEQIKKLDESVKYAFDRINDFLGEINLDEDVEITKIKILYLIYNELKGINEKLDKISNNGGNK